MKLSKILLPFMVLLLVLSFSCNQNNNFEELPSIELNQGEKWKVNSEMMIHIRAAETLFSDYITNKNTDYKKLAEGLSENNTKLINSCTMKGKAHDELHKWLHPHLQMVEALGEATSPEEASRTIKLLETSFQTLNTYFD